MYDESEEIVFYRDSWRCSVTLVSFVGSIGFEEPLPGVKSSELPVPQGHVVVQPDQFHQHV